MTGSQLSLVSAYDELMETEVPEEDLYKYNAVETFLNNSCKELTMSQIEFFSRRYILHHFGLNKKLDIKPLLTDLRRSRKANHA